MKRLAHAGRRGVRMAVLTAAAVLLASSAIADLTGSADIRAAVDGKSDETLITANPVLEKLSRQRPALLQQALKRLRTPVAPPASRSSSSEEPLSEADTMLLDENPDLSELFRESPEAALDLLHLIEEATKQK